ncbi:MAG: glycosyltransferase [Pleomorphochaeta sp.]
MKIIHFSCTHFEEYGGVPAVLFDLVNHQNKIYNLSSIIFTLNKEIPSRFSNIMKSYSNYKELFKSILDFSPDFVVFHTVYHTEYIKVSRFLINKNIKYYIEPHSSFMVKAQEKSKLKKKIANKFFFKRFISGSTGSIYLNYNEKINSIYSSINDLIIPNGINMPTIYNKNKGLNFYYIGRYDINHKGLDILFDALELIDNRGLKFEITLWGVDDGFGYSYLKNRIVNFSTVKVHLNGPIFGNDKVEIISKNFHILVLTSRYEGFPMSILEAWSYGCKCVVTPETNVADVVLDNDLGWVVSLDAESISTKLIELFSNQNNIKINSNKIKHYVYQNYSWEKIAALSSDLLNSNK